MPYLIDFGKGLSESHWIFIKWPGKNNADKTTIDLTQKWVSSRAHSQNILLSVAYGQSRGICQQGLHWTLCQLPSKFSSVKNGWKYIVTYPWQWYGAGRGASAHQRINFTAWNDLGRLERWGSGLVWGTVPQRWGGGPAWRRCREVSVCWLNLAQVGRAGRKAPE